jgi:hypothetical protein
MNARTTTVLVRLTGIGLAVALLGAACGSGEREDGMIVAGDTQEDGSIDAGDSVGLARLETAAIVRLVTVDHGFGSGSPPFDLVQVGTSVGGDTSRPVEELALELTADTLADQFPVEFVSDIDATIAEHFDHETMGVAVAAIDDVRIDADRAEIEMRLWCGSLCGVFLTYEAVLGSSGWEIVGTTGPIAMS